MRRIGRVVVDVYLTSAGELERTDAMWIPAGEDHHIDHRGDQLVTTGDQRSGHGDQVVAERKTTTGDQLVTTALESFSNSRVREDSPSNSPSGDSDWWSEYGSLEVLHRRFRWSREPRGETRALLERMWDHPLTGPDRHSGDRWVAAQLETLSVKKGTRIVHHVYEKQFLPLLAEPATDAAPAPEPTVRDARPTQAVTALREAIARSMSDQDRVELQALIDNPATHPDARRAAERTLERHGAPTPPAH